MNTLLLANKIRKHAVMMAHWGKSSHVGSVLSMADIVAVLYGAVLKKNPENPKWPDRDRCILSKGHGCTGIYAALAETGYFPTEALKTHYANGSMLCGHVSHLGIPGIECSTGSLGHGLPIGAGMALAAKLDRRTHRIYVILSDGECDEGSTWESVLFAAHHRLSNLIAIVDYNKIQGVARVDDAIRLEPFAAKWDAFGWNVRETNGHNHTALTECLDVYPENEEKPTCIIAHTVKGKGVSFMENSILWHYRTPQGEELLAAMQELEKSENA